jgi:hypothetical protein
LYTPARCFTLAALAGGRGGASNPLNAVPAVLLAADSPSEKRFAISTYVEERLALRKHVMALAVDEVANERLGGAKAMHPRTRRASIGLGSARTAPGRISSDLYAVGSRCNASAM